MQILHKKLSAQALTAQVSKRNGMQSGASMYFDLNNIRD